jgi:hypothetical protein
MNCRVENYSQIENYKSYGAPVLAEDFRFLFGLLMVFGGLYIATLSDIQGHGLGLLLVIGSPFVIFKDGK